MLIRLPSCGIRALVRSQRTGIGTARERWVVAVLEIMSHCQSLRDLDRFAERHHGVLTEALGIELRPPSDSA